MVRVRVGVGVRVRAGVRVRVQWQNGYLHGDEVGVRPLAVEVVERLALLVRGRVRVRVRGKG